MTHFCRLLNIGLIANHAIEGKNNIGTTSPGNNSGNSIFKGSVIETGITIREKDRTDNVRLKNNSVFFLIHFTKAACINAIRIEADKFIPRILNRFTILEKSASLANKYTRE